MIAVEARRDAVPLGAIFFVIAVAAAFGVAVLHLDRLPIATCAFKTVTGWPCLSCGTTRALAHLVTGDLAGAASMNPLATAGILALVPWGLADLALLPRGRAVSLDVAPATWRVLRLVIPVLLVANWAYLIASGR